jgi:hypothetical protein
MWDEISYSPCAGEGGSRDECRFNPKFKKMGETYEFQRARGEILVLLHVGRHASDRARSSACESSGHKAE